MGLQVWLPLNGSLENRGLNPMTFSYAGGSTGLATNTNGKIGSCFERTSKQGNCIRSSANLLLDNDFSMACWAYVSGTEASANGLVTNHNHSTCSGAGITVRQVSTSDFRISCNTGYKTDRTYHTYYGTTNIANKWAHLGLTYSRSAKQLKLYVNGVVEYTLNNYDNYAVSNPIDIFNWSTGYYTASDYKTLCKMNDVRIYDHCLSQKEMKEISKGLCLHYTLNNNGCGQENLVAGSATFDGWSIASGWTKAQDTDGTTYIKFSRTGATANAWTRAIPTVKLNPNDYPNGITVSFDFKVTDLSALNHKCIVALQIYKSDGTRIGWNEPNNTSFTNYDRIVNGQWVRIARHFTQTDLLRISTSGYTTADVSYTMISFQLVQNGEIFIRKVKAEVGNTMTPWTANSADAFYNSTEFDSSGYRNNAIPIDATIKHLSGSPRYTVYTKFDGSTSGLKIDNTAQIVPVLNNGIFTISFWVKHDVSSNREIYFGNFDASADFNLERTAGNVLRFYWNASPDLTMTGTTMSDTNWHHVVVIRNGSSVKGYIDGVLKYDGTATISSLSFDGSFRIGRDTRTGSTAFGGGMSDFRLYATALSETDVKELYNTPAAIDNMGNAFAMQLVEVI